MTSDKRNPPKPGRAPKTRILFGIGFLFAISILGITVYSYLRHRTFENDFPPDGSYGFDIGTTDGKPLENLVLEEIDIDPHTEAYEAYNDKKESEANNQQSPQTSANTPSQNSNSTSSDFASYPDEILACTRGGDDLLVLVNKQYRLPETYAPTDLVELSNHGIRVTKSGLLIRNIITSDLSDMDQAAAGQGIDLAALSAYRSYETQQNTYNYWVQYNGGNTAAADTISARPGHSQHQLGTTIDFTTNEISDQLGQHFANTKAGKWLAEHAWEYGFALGYPEGWESETGYSYEPWHYRYIGKNNAAEWHTSGKILELWLREKN